MNLKNELIKMAAARVIELEAARAQASAEEEATKQASYTEDDLKIALAEEIIKEALLKELGTQEVSEPVAGPVAEPVKEASTEDKLRQIIIDVLGKQETEKQAAQDELEKEAINKKLLAGLAAALGLGGTAYAGHEGMLGDDVQGALGGGGSSLEQLISELGSAGAAGNISGNAAGSSIADLLS